MARTLIGIALLGIFLLSGSSGIGAPAITRDRFDYNVAIAESWKSQMLLNIVKIRYADTPVFMDVTSVINLSGAQHTVNASAGWSFPPNANSQSIGGTTTWGEKPTITYAPISGDKFTKSLLTPIPPGSLVMMMQSGWPARFLFTLCVKSVKAIVDENGKVVSYDLAKVLNAGPSMFTYVPLSCTWGRAGPSSTAITSRAFSWLLWSA